MDRQTQQRRVIQEVLASSERPLTPQEIVERSEQIGARLGIATVYRNVKRLHEDGFLAPVELPNEPVRYELADQAHHHHFRCGSCGKVFDVPGCSSGLSRNLPAGFVMERHEVLLFGTCADCNA